MSKIGFINRQKINGFTSSLPTAQTQINVQFHNRLKGDSTPVLLVQMLNYYKHHPPTEPKWFRCLALYLLMAETANVVFDIGLIFEPLALNALEVSPLLLRPDAAVTVAISTPVQLFVAWRIKVVAHCCSRKPSTMSSVVCPAIVALTSFVSFAGGLSVTIMVSLHSNYAEFANFQPFVITWLSATAACDVILSTALIYSLHTRKSGMADTDRYVERIIRLTLQTGSITADAALLDLFVFLFAPSATLQFIWDFPLSKLYSIALLSSLNARPRKGVAALDDDTNVLFARSPANSLRAPSSAIHTSSGLELHHRRREGYPDHGNGVDVERGSEGSF
ncbi:hypothetical protein C8R47DRAFT_1223371 [Mycena vitilis]|nr:hypothetical protein C8R47DRAFT_1223371 [Mycena vitilis]